MKKRGPKKRGPKKLKLELVQVLVPSVLGKWIRVRAKEAKVGKSRFLREVLQGIMEEIEEGEVLQGIMGKIEEKEMRG